MAHFGDRSGMSLRAATLLSLVLALVDTAAVCAAEADPVLASWYGARYRGRPTASGERFDPGAFTAAHPSLDFGTLVEVTRWTDGRRVVVRINDRGPAAGRGIDLSEAAARRIGLTAEGTGLVTLRLLPVTAER